MCVCVCVCVCARVRVRVRVRARACVRACVRAGEWVGSQCARHGRFILAASVLGTVDLFRQPVC